MVHFIETILEGFKLCNEKGGVFRIHLIDPVTKWVSPTQPRVLLVKDVETQNYYAICNILLSNRFVLTHIHSDSYPFEEDECTRIKNEIARDIMNNASKISRLDVTKSKDYYCLSKGSASAQQAVTLLKIKGIIK